jgi:hypothetical protein
MATAAGEIFPPIRVGTVLPLPPRGTQPPGPFGPA